MKPDSQFAGTLTRWQRIAAIVGFVGAVLCVVAWFAAPAAFYQAYLVSFLFWAGLALGCLAISLLHHLTGGGWGVPIRRIVESGASTLPLLALLFVPFAFGMPILYEWADPEHVAHDEILQRKVNYLNVEFFLIRAAIYFVLWSAFAFLTNLLTANSSATTQEQRARLLGLISGPGLVLWGLCVTFAAVDWGMSLEPHWFSSMYGVLFVGGQAVSAFSLSIIVAVLLRRFPASSNVLTTARLHDLGNFLLAFVMFWSYVSFMQFLIIWSGNLPEETPYYLKRSGGGWNYVAGTLMGMHFLVPFMLLLIRPMKRNAYRLMGIASWLLLMRFVDLCWLVLPAFSERIFLPWPLLVTMPAIGGLWIAMFAWRLATRGPLVVHEFHAPEASDERAQPARH